MNNLYNKMNKFLYKLLSYNLVSQNERIVNRWQSAYYQAP